MRVAQIDAGVVVDIGLLMEGDSIPAGMVACPPDVGPGWTYDGEVFAPPSAAVDAPPQAVTGGLATFVRVDGARVVDVLRVPAGVPLAHAIHPDLAGQFIPAPDAVDSGWVVDGGGFAPPPAVVPDLEAIKTGARMQVVKAADAITARITGRYPAAEVASWPTQEIEARAVQAGSPEVETPLVVALAGQFGVSRADMAAAILAKAAGYRQVVAAVIAVRDQTMQAIAVSPDAAAVDVVLSAARAQAEAMAATLGIGG